MSKPDRFLHRLWSARGRLHVAFLQRTGLLPYFNLTGSARVGRSVFRVPISQGIWLSGVDPEPWLDVILDRLLRNDHGVFVDVGANLGQTLLKVKSLSRNIEYRGFEPNPKCYCYLQELIALNAMPGCRAYPFALGQAPAVLELFHSSSVDVAASLVDGFRPSTEYSAKQFASVFRGDEVLHDPGGKISTVKIDVEGAELDVILGLRESIERDRPTIVCEVLPVYDDTTEIGRFRLGRQQRMESFLHGVGYSIERIVADGSTVKLDEIGVHGDLALSNYLFVPG